MKIKLLKKILITHLILIMFGTKIFSMETPNILNNDLLQKLARLGPELTRAAYEARKTNRQETEFEINQIQREIDSATRNKKPEKDIDFLRNKRNNLQKQTDDEIKQNSDLANNLSKVVVKGLNGVFEYHQAEQNSKRDLKKAAIEAAIITRENNKGQMERMQEFLKLKNLGIISGTIILTASGLSGCYYGFKLLFNYLDAKIGRPSLIRESSRHGYTDAFKKYWNQKVLGKKEKKPNLKDVILEPKMASKLKLLAEDTRKTQENGLPYRHTLFYGLPGTGKTMFAKRLAQFSGMDYAIMSGADFGQFTEGQDITELHKLFDWAEQSKKGLLIFVDEADAFLRDRRILNNQGKNLINAFLTRTGTSSQKYMLVFATNYEDELDPAALSRINKKIYFPLPALPERIKILNLYMDKYIINDERTIKQGDTIINVKITIDNNIDVNFINNVARKIDGFSGREIEQLVSELRVDAYNIGNYVLTTQIINNVVDEKIAEHKHDVECAQSQRKRYEKEIGQTQISMNNSK